MYFIGLLNLFFNNYYNIKECHFLQEALKVLRLIDDKIIYELNKSVPTSSFSGEINAEQKCRELYTEVMKL